MLTMPLADHSAMTLDERLLLDVVKALRGADHLRDRLLTSLQSGTPAVADLAYAVKARVKEDYKVIEKITGKRIERPSYGVADVTDIVGLRIITLYRLDMLQVIDALLAAIDADKSESGAFVSGSISEIMIYSTNPTGDAQDLPKRMKALFEQRGFAANIVEKPSNYTSIHILVMGRGRYRDGYRNLPIEIQIRTALEDVWGQIEHGLKYKRQRIEKREGNNDSRRLETSLNHLGVLKTLIDGVAQYADQIKLQIDELEPSLRYGSSRSIEEPNARLKNLTDLPTPIREEIEAAVKEAQPVLEESAGKPSERAHALSDVLTRLKNIESSVAELPELRARTRREVVYVLTMQRALVHFQLGNLIDEGEEQYQLQQALLLYQEMEMTFPKRLVVAYRIARTLDALGQRSKAIEKLRALVHSLSVEGEPTPKRHWIRSAAPRILGVLLWEEADATRGGHGTERGLAGPRALALLQEAFAVTRAAYEIKVREDPEDNTTPSERAKAANNLLYFLLEFVEGGGGAQEGMGEEDIARYLDEIGAADPNVMTDHQFADTARRAYAHLGDHQNEQLAAKKLLELTGSGAAVNDPYIRKAIRAAHAALADADVALA
jgi:ppGpp synthetase/RelA/SpoT-type nucleotidyltranferase